MQLNPRTKYLLSTLNEHRLLLIVPTIAGFVLALTYVMLFRSESWTSRQRLLIRDDLLGQPQKPGKFDSLEAMKSRQETILEIARSPEVIVEVLKDLGPVKKGFWSNLSAFPDVKTIESYQGKIRLTAPNGGELGKTETVMLTVKEANPDRSHRFIERLLDEVELATQHVRWSMLQSMEQEIQRSRDGAWDALERSIAQMRTMELALGLDTAVMANMSSVMAGENSLRQEVTQLENEKRVIEAQLESLKTAKQILEMAKSDPHLIVTSSSPFLRDQQKLNQVARSMVDAQKEHADVVSRYQEIHPTVQNAIERLEVMKVHLSQELSGLALTLNSQIRESVAQIDRLNSEIENRTQRLATLSNRRADHLVINAELAKRAEKLNELDNLLDNIRSFRETGEGAPWISRVGAPQTASAPDGLTKRSSVLIGGFLGFMFGLGLVMLFAPPFDDSPYQAVLESNLSNETPVNVALHRRDPNNDLANQDRLTGGASRGSTIAKQSTTQPSVGPIESNDDQTTATEDELATTSDDDFDYQKNEEQQLERLGKLLGNKKGSQPQWQLSVLNQEPGKSAERSEFESKRNQPDEVICIDDLTVTKEVAENQRQAQSQIELDEIQSINQSLNSTISNPFSPTPSNT